MSRLTVRVPDDLRLLLEKRAKDAGRRLSDEIRVALERHARLRLGQETVPTSGPLAKR